MTNDKYNISESSQDSSDDLLAESEVISTTTPTSEIPNIPMNIAKYPLGAQVKHRVFPFRGIVFDVDPHFSNTDEWYEKIPAEIRPKKDQPFYHLLAENDDDHTYIAYVSEQNLMPDTSDTPIKHDAIGTFFSGSLESGLQSRQAIH